MANRIDRINEEARKEISSIIRELKDPRIHPMTSIVLAQVTPDLKYCKVYVSVLADEERANETIRGLKSAEGFIRTQLAKKINLRNTPDVTFVLDQSIEYGVRMSRLIDDVTKDLPDEEEEEQKFDPTAGLADLGKNLADDIPFAGNIGAVLGIGDGRLPLPSIDSETIGAGFKKLINAETDEEKKKEKELSQDPWSTSHNSYSFCVFLGSEKVS